MKLNKRLKLYLLKIEVRSLKRYLNRIELYIYFDGWTGQECIDESNYLRDLIKEKENEINRQ